MPSSEALQFKEEFTLESWVKPEGELTHLPILYKAGEGFPAYDLGIGLTTAGRGEGQIGTVAKGHTDAATPAAMEAGVWQHLAVTFDGTKLRLYLNGELVATKAVTEPNSAVAGALTIGCGSTYHFKGRIDEVRIYNRALEAGEVAIDRIAPIQTPQAGPVADYPLDEGEGTVAHDVSGGAHEGTLSAEGVSWAPGRYGTALKFDGAKGCVTVPDSEALRLREEFTLEAWVRPEGELLHLPAITKQAETFPAYALGIGFNTAGKAEGQIGTEAKSHTDIASTASLEANVWQHEALTFDGTKLKLYVNGELVATKPVEKTNSAALGALEIGCSASQHFKGRIDEVRIYNRALEAGEVVTSMQPLPRVTTGETFGVDDEEAVLSGTVNAMGLKTSVTYEYGLTTSYGNVYPTSPEEIEEFYFSKAAEPVEQIIAELEPETTYHYRVTATNANGTVVGEDRTVTTLAPELEGAIAPKEFSGLVGVTWSGNQATYTHESALKYSADAGAKMFRIVIVPGYSAEEKKRYKEENDELFTFAAQNHIKILPVVTGIPGPPISGSAGNTLPKIGPGSPGRKRWEAGLRLLVERYGPEGEFWAKHSGLEESLAPVYWEIWNEENDEKNADAEIVRAGEGQEVEGKIDPARYGTLLEISHNVLEEVNKTRKTNAEVMFGGLLTGPRRQIYPPDSHLPVGRYIREVGHPTDYAALSVHPYAFKGSVATVADKVRNNVAEARAAIKPLEKKPGVSSKKIWVTEIGWPVKSPPEGGLENDPIHPAVSEAVQAERLTAVFNKLKSLSGNEPNELNIGNILWYNIQDYTDGNKNRKSWEAHCGLVLQSGKHRSAFDAFHEQAE